MLVDNPLRLAGPSYSHPRFGLSFLVKGVIRELRDRLGACFRPRKNFRSILGVPRDQIVVCAMARLGF